MEGRRSLRSTAEWVRRLQRILHQSVMWRKCWAKRWRPRFTSQSNTSRSAQCPPDWATWALHSRMSATRPIIFISIDLGNTQHAGKLDTQFFAVHHLMLHVTRDLRVVKYKGYHPRFRNRNLILLIYLKRFRNSLLTPVGGMCVFLNLQSSTRGLEVWGFYAVS